jgi:hypothetical protein
MGDRVRKAAARAAVAASDKTGRPVDPRVESLASSDPWLINDRIKAAASRWFGVSDRAAAGFGAFLCGELGLTEECRYEPLGAGIPTAHRWVTAWELPE